MPWRKNGEQGEMLFRCPHIKVQGDKCSAEVGEMCLWPDFKLVVTGEGDVRVLCEDCGSNYPINEAIRNIPGKLNRFVVREE